MLIESKYTKQFVSDDITKLKYHQIFDFAIQLRNYKNKISKEINSDLYKYINMGKFEFISYMRKKYHKEISSYFEEAVYTQVYTCYQNKFNAIIHKISFKVREFKSFNLYKRTTKLHKAGELKSVSYENKTTDLSVCLTYLARYGNENILEYIHSVYNQSDKKKQEFYDKILRVIDKFRFERLYKLALRKRLRILKSYKEPVEFKSLTFSGKTTNVTTIISRNKNKKSKLDTFITLNVPFRDKLDIPVKYSKSYHCKITDYQKIKFKDKKLVKQQYCYTVKINEKNKSVEVLLCKDGQREYPENKENYIGIDINVKHNLFALSNNTTYDYDRELVNDLLNVKNSNKNDKRTRIKEQTLTRKLKQTNQQLISQVCKDIKFQGFNHIVLENISNFSKSYVKNAEFNEKYTRIESILNIGTLKAEFLHIAKNYGIQVSIIPSEYTSQQCEVCGCIDSENRLDQEHFCCTHCGHSMNADLHAAINIRNRVADTVYHMLLKKDSTGGFIPKQLSHKHIRDKLLQLSVVQMQNYSKFAQSDIDIPK